MKKSILNSRRFRQGTAATIITVIVVALIVFVNLIGETLTERFDLRFDLTPNKVFEISDETLEFLDTLETDVNIYILSQEADFIAGGQYFIQANEVIRQYEKSSDRVKLTYVDIVRDPAFASRYPDLQLNVGSIVVASGENSVSVGAYDLFNVQQSYEGVQITSSKAEHAMTSAILRVTSEDAVIVSVLTDNTGADISEFVSLINTNNYRIVEQNLMTEEVSRDASIVILALPTRDYTEAELEKLDRFLENDGKKGKSLIYFTNATQSDDLTNLSTFLAEWGIATVPGVVYETNAANYYNQNPIHPFVTYMDETIYGDLIQQHLYPVVPQGKPLAIIPTSDQRRFTSVLLQYSDTSVVLPLDADASWSPSSAELGGPMPAAILSRSLSNSGTETLSSTVVAVSSISMLDPSLLTHPGLGNGDFFLTLFDSLTGRLDRFQILPKQIGGDQIIINNAQFIVIALCVMVILPLAILITGLVVWMRRRHL